MTADQPAGDDERWTLPIRTFLQLVGDDLPDRADADDDAVDDNADPPRQDEHAEDTHSQSHEDGDGL